MKYRPDIDGLRALAILPVVLFHAQLGCTGGFVGVDIFFVISGFLISSIILKELRDGTFSLIGFWERRIRRIFPALAVLVLALLVAGWFLYLPEEFESLAKSVIAQVALLSNLYFYRQGRLSGGYFAPATNDNTLLHTWSLAVEEQFYLVLPLLLLFLARYKKISLTNTILGMAVVSLVLSIATMYSHPMETFYFLPTRAWELLLGTLLVLLIGRWNCSPPAREFAGWIGVALIAYAIFFYNKNTRFPGLAAMPPCIGAALVIFSSESKLSRVGRFLAWKPAVYVGLISYPLYLWHWPILVMARYWNMPYGEPSAAVRAALVFFSAVPAYLSWKFVETPIRKRRILQRRSQVFGFAAVVTLALLTLALLIYRTGGVPIGRLPANVVRYSATRSHFAFRETMSLDQGIACQYTEFGTGKPDQPIDLLVWGDSHAMAITPALDELCRLHSWRGVMAAFDGAPPLVGYVNKSSKSLFVKRSSDLALGVMGYIAQQKIKNVVITARWGMYPITAEFRAQLIHSVQTVLNSGARVYVMKDVPVPGFNVPQTVAITAMRHGDLDQLGITPDLYKQQEKGLAETFDQIGKMGATVLDAKDYFLNERGIYGVVKNDQVLYWDNNHLSLEGANLLVPLFQPIFQKSPSQRGYAGS